MKLVRLAVERFQAIESAELELGPGLNVLYGPNDLGKSSLAWAIRAVLLLQHNSAQHERFVSWYGGGAPTVSLTLIDDEGRFWRVTKVFGTTHGRSTLESSKDGRTFTPDANGRQVDEKLRSLMRWGIPAPGSSGGGRGMPESFLTQVLLAEQANVREVLFGASIANDPDEGGRQRLVEALGALAQDPLFKQILDTAQDKVDEAFTSKGNKKKSAGSPFKAISERVKELHRERDELATRLRDTESAEARVRQLAAERDELVEDHAEAKAELERAERELVVQTQRAALRARIAGHEQTVRDAAARDKQISEGSAVLANAEEKLAQIGKQVKAATSAVEKAEAARDAARSELDRLSHDDKYDRIKTELEEAVRTATEAHLAAQQDERHVADELARARTLLVQVKALEAELAELSSTSSSAGREKELWTAVAIAAVGKLRAEEQVLRGKAHAKLPNPSTLAELRELRESLRIAEAKLEVGLAVSIKPKQAVAIKTRRDGGKETASKGAEAKTISAKRSIGLVIDDVVELEISAGDETAREELGELQERWNASGGKLLAEYKVESLEELDKLRVRSDEALRAADDKQRAAEAIERYTSAIDPPELDEDDEAEVASRLAKLKTDVAAKVIERLAELERGAVDSSKQIVVETKLAALRAQLDLPAEMASAPKKKPAKPVDPLESKQRAVAEAEQKKTAAKQALEAATAKLATLQRDRATAIKNVRDRMTKLEAEAKTARATADSLSKQRAEVSDLLTKFRVQLAELTATQAATNVEAARAEIAKVRPELDALGPAPGGELEDSDIENLRQRVQRSEHRLRETEAELHKARGALEQVGGTSVRERQRDLDQAIEHAEAREREIAVEYEAWKLLVDTMREAEATEGAHLGKALAGPVSRRFRELTGGGYGDLELGAALDSPSLTVAGELRDPATLSAGTQDQLATLLRLCVAEQLKSSIVLDDHLAQSDLGRVGWFNRVLRSAAEQIQIVFITCRPGELLAPSELPTGADAIRNLAGGRVRAIDLSRTIRRYGNRA